MKKIEICKFPDLQRLKVYWKKQPPQVDIEKILGPECVWQGRLFGEKQSLGVNSVHKSKASYYISIRRAIVEYEAVNLISLSHLVDEALSWVTKNLDEANPTIEVYKRLKIRKAVQNHCIEEGICHPALIEYAEVDFHDVYILNELRLVLINRTDNATYGTIKSILKRVLENPSISDESKSMIRHWEESCSILTLTREDTRKAHEADQEQSFRVLNDLDDLSLVALFPPLHSKDFYTIANSSLIHVDSPSFIMRTWYVMLLDSIYRCLRRHLRRLLCQDPLINRRSERTQRNTEKKFHGITLTFPVSWIIGCDRHYFTIDHLTKKATIRLSIDWLKSVFQELLSPEKWETRNIETDPYIDLEHEIREYCTNIFNAFFKPEKAIIERVEKLSGKKLISTFLNCVCEEVLAIEEPTGLAIYINELARQRNQNEPQDAK